MKIELVEFYPLEEKKEKRYLKGTLHIFLADFGIDIRGILFIFRKDKVMMRFPYRSALDPDTKQFVQYPIFNFVDIKKSQELHSLTKFMGTEYIKKIYFPENKAEKVEVSK